MKGRMKRLCQRIFQAPVFLEEKKEIRAADKDRAWCADELNRMLAYALKQGREDYITVLYLGRYAGLRVNECYQIDTEQAARAIIEKTLIVKESSGQIRSVPINAILVNRLKLHLQNAPSSGKLLPPYQCPDRIKIQNFCNFILEFGPAVQSHHYDDHMTYDGLRKTCAQTWYEKKLQSGRNPDQANKEVLDLLGREQDPVAAEYLKKGEDL